MLYRLFARAHVLLIAAGVVLPVGGCTGSIARGERIEDEDLVTGAPDRRRSGPGALPPGTESNGGETGVGGEAIYFRSAARRLTKVELQRTLLDLVGVDLSPELAKFPEDYAEANDVFAFDNKYTLQQPSAALVQAAKNVADAVGGHILSDPAVQARLLPCKPSGPEDAACLRAFVTAFGRRVLRRPLSAEEVGSYVTKFQPLAAEANDFFRAVSLVARVMLQDLEFLYRVEIGQPVAGAAGLLKLSGYEIASRLSYFLWGTAPDDALLEAAGTGDRLGTPTAVRATAARMLADGRTRYGLNKFHAMWLGYERQPPASLQKPMLEETEALIERVMLKEKTSWLNLFSAKETYVDLTLAAHYGLPRPTAASGWVSYGSSGRQGILSHGTFLGVERKHQDTSPTMRGHFIRTRLLCQRIPEPPPDLDTDNAPAEGSCKADRYGMWKMPGCQSCHRLMDPVGLGLENYDQLGRHRTLAPDDQGKTGCTLTGEGDLVALDPTSAGAFKGVAGLSERLVATGALEACVTTQMANYYLGRELTDEERPVFERIAARFRASGQRFDQMLLDFVSLPGFGHRLAE
jgi:hypothetical protein